MSAFTRTVARLTIVAFAMVVGACEDATETPVSTTLATQGLEAQANGDGGGEFHPDPRRGNPRVVGAAGEDSDPENSSNVVVSTEIHTGSNPPTGVQRDLRVKIIRLDNLLSFKSYFEGSRTCGGGSPRIQLLIDADGDGKFTQSPDGVDFAAHGHVNPPTYTGCPPDVWQFHDMTDDQLRWEITPASALPAIGNFPYDTWEELETQVSAAFPDHVVLEGFLIEDFTNSPPGKAYYDLITLGVVTLATWGDSQVQPPSNQRGRP